MCAPLLRSDIKQLVVYRGEAPPPEAKLLRWWEDAPGVRSLVAERVIPGEERDRRASYWRRRHPEQIVTCCANAWPARPLHLSDYEHAGETR